MSPRRRGSGGAVVRQSFLSGGMASVAIATGLLLDVVAAAVFGAGRDTDAFVVAARFPLSLTAILMLIGNQVLLPTFALWSTTLTPQRARRLVSTTFLGALLLGGLVAGLLALTAPLLVAVMAPGFHDEQRTLSAELLRVMAWTVPLTAGCEVLRAWLNARHHFAIPAAMTVVLNLVAAGVVVAYPGDISILPLAYLAGSAAQLVLMLGYAVARGLRFGVPVPGDTESHALLGLLVRPGVAATLNPLARAAETFVASFLPPGSVTVLHYGNRLVHAIGGTVLFRSVMVAVLPRLTRAFAEGDRGESDRLSRLGLRLMVAVSLPLTGLGLVLAVPAAEVVFGVGRFSAEDARLLGMVIAVLSLSFPASAVQRALLSPFYAVRDTRVPLQNSLVGALVNLVALPVCVLPLLGTGYALLGIAAAYVVSNLANVAHAWWRLRRSDLGTPHLAPGRLTRSVLASAAGAGVALLVWDGARETLPGAAPVRLVAAGLLGLLAVVAVERLRLRLRLRPRRRLVTAEPSSPVHARRVRDARPVPSASSALLAALALSGAAAVTVSSLALVEGWSPVAIAAPVGFFVGAGLLSLAIGRFEMFLLALLVTRTAVDALSFGGGVPVDPSALLGILLLGAGTTWLVAQWIEAGRVQLTPLGWAAAGFAVAALLGVLVAPTPGPALVEWTRIASVCVTLLIVERAAVRPAFRRQLVVAVAAAAIVPLGVAAWQYWTGAGLFDAGGFSRVRGTFSHSNPLAAFLALLVIMMFAHVLHLRKPEPRIWTGLVMVVAGVGLLATYTRAAWLAALIGVAVVAAARGRRWLGGVALVLLILVISVPGVSSRFSDLGEDATSRGEPSNSLTWRAEYWGEALDLVEASPITGIGLKQVAAQSDEGKQPHNDVLRAYVEMGLVGLAAYLWLLWQILATGVRGLRATRDGPPENRALAVGYAGAAVGYVLMCLVANLMSQVVVGIYFAAFAGAGAALVAARTRRTRSDAGEPVAALVGEGSAACASST